MNTVRTPASRPASISRQRSPTRKLRLQVDAAILCRARNQTRLGLAARAFIAIVMRADAHVVQMQLARKPRVHLVESALGQRASCDVRLIRNHHQQVARIVEHSAGFTDTGQQFELAQAAGGYGRPSRTTARFSTPSRSRNTALFFGVGAMETQPLTASRAARPAPARAWNRTRHRPSRASNASRATGCDRCSAARSARRPSNHDRHPCR